MRKVLIGLIFLFLTGVILANTSYPGDYAVRPSRQGGVGEPAYVPSDASADGTANTQFTFIILVHKPQNEIWWQLPTLIIDGVGSYSMWMGWAVSAEDAYWVAVVPGWDMVGQFYTDGPRSFTWYVISSSAAANATQPPDIVESPRRTLVVTGIYREQLVPVGGAYGHGVTIEPSDSGQPDAGSSSCVYTFRVRYSHPEGLPPRWFVNTDYDYYPASQDNWRDPHTGDFPSTVAMSDNLRHIGTPVVWVKDRANNTNPPKEGAWLPHFLVVESPEKPVDQLTGADYRNGVVFKYTVQPTEYLGSVEQSWTRSYNGMKAYTVDPEASTSYIVYAQRTARGSSDIQGRPFTNHYTSFGDYGARGYIEPAGHNNPGYPTRRLDSGAGDGAGRDYTFSQDKIAYYFEATADFRPPNRDGDGEVSYRWTGGPEPQIDVPGKDKYDYTRRVTLYDNQVPVTLYPLDAALGWQVPEQIPGYGSSIFPYYVWNSPVLNQGGFTYGYTGWKYGSEKFKDHDPMKGVGNAPLIQITTDPLEVWTPQGNGTLLLSVNNGNPAQEVSPIPRPAPYKWRRVTAYSKIRFWVKYTQPKNVAPHRVRVFLYDYGKGKWIEYWMTRYESSPNNGDYGDGEWYYFETTLPPGKYATFFDTNDTWRTAKFPRRPDDDPHSRPNDIVYGVRMTLPNPPDLDVNPDPWDNPVGNDYLPGPWVNNPPVLWGESLSPVSGTSGTTFTWEIRYKDADNDPPRFPLLVITKIDPQTGNVLETRRFVMQRTAWIGSPNDWATGAVFRYISKYFNPETQEPFQPNFLYRYHFEFTDDWGEPNYPETGETVKYPFAYDISGPDITANQRPFIGDASLATQTGFTPTPQTLITWKAAYYDLDNDAPQWVKIRIAQTTNAGASWNYNFIGSTMEQENPQDTLYKDGATFVFSSLLPYGPNTFYSIGFTANDGKDDDVPASVSKAYGGGVVTISGMGRTLGAVDINLGTIENTWTLVYKDTAGQPPQSVQVKVQRKVGDSWQDYGSVQMNLVGGDPSTGATYAGTIPLPTFDATNFYFIYRASFLITLQDGTPLEISYPESPFILGPKVVPNTPPKLLPPGADPKSAPDDATASQCISPRDPQTGVSTGGMNDPFTFTVMFVDDNNQLPSYIKLVTEAKSYDLQEVDPNDKLTMDGKLYQVVLNGSDLGTGQHYFHFEASDGTDSVRFPSSTQVNIPPFIKDGEVQLPYVNDKPVLSNIAISSTIGIPDTTPFKFTATYSDANNDPPAYVRTVVEKKQDSTWAQYTVLSMGKVDPSAVDYVKGVEYQVISTFPRGEYRFYVEASDGRLYNNYTSAPEEDKRIVFRVGMVISISPEPPIDIGKNPQVTITVSAMPNQAGHITVTKPNGQMVIDKDINTDNQGSYTETVAPDVPGTWSVTVNIGGEEQTKQFEVIVTQDFPAISMATISLNVSGASIEDIFGPTFPKQNLAWWNPQAGGYVYGNQPNFPTFVPGLGFWVKGPVTATITQGSRVTTATQYGVRTGWNIVGNPFLTDMDISSLGVLVGNNVIGLTEAEKQGLVKGYLWGFDETAKDYYLIHPALSGANRTLKSWKGYWIRALQNATLVFSPSKGEAEVRMVKEEGWKVQIIASSAGSRDSCNYIGIGDSRFLAGVENPPSKGGVDLYFLRGEEKLAWDVREKAERCEWKVVVEGTGDITLSWPNLSSLPKGYVLYLVDGDKRVNMLTTSSYTFTSPAGRKEMSIVYERRGNALVVSGLTAKPVRGGVSIAFNLSMPAVVNLRVKAMDGRVLKEMRRDGAMGMNTLAWDGRDEKGNLLPAGIYMVEVVARGDDNSLARGITTFILR